MVLLLQTTGTPLSISGYIVLIAALALIAVRYLKSVVSDTA